ncbi:MAG: dephospho-CoA kinase [Xanthomonadaceae bacterium]|nr:dephospho-CoA kinase [Xanthomonadaceae bacterium]
MLKIGLTGSIASGRTTIARMFSALGVQVIDNSSSLALSRAQVEKIFHCLQTIH